MVRVVDLLQYLLEERGSDLLVKVGSPPVIRRNGRLERTTLDALDPDAIAALASEILSPQKAQELQTLGETDLAHSVRGLGRFRVSVYRQRGSVSLAVRRVVPGAPSISELGVPPIVATLASNTDGLIIVSGPFASGKTTTASAMVDHVNGSRACHIITVEDPIEVLHSDRTAVVSQREVGVDTPEIAEALRRVARQDADVIFVSDLPTTDAISEALAAASSGRLVIAVLNTLTAIDTVNALSERFEPHLQMSVRATLGRVLRGVICQRLVERSDGRGRVALVETLVGTPKVRELIARGGDNTAALEQLMIDGDYHGMQTFDQALFRLFSEDQVSLEEALERASNPEDFRIAAQRAGHTVLH